MAIAKEINLRLPNSPGALADATRLLADEHVNVMAAALEATGRLRLVVDNHLRACGALRARHHKVEERDVLLVGVPNDSGALASVLRLAADAGVNLDYAYASAGDRATHTVVVLGVEDAVRAAAATGL
jgi:hypothetical protein